MSAIVPKYCPNPSQAKLLEEYKEEINPMNFNELFNFVNDFCREIVLWELVEDLMENFQESFDFGEILTALAEYTSKETEREHEIKTAYEAVSKLLFTAARAARKTPLESPPASVGRVYLEAKAIKAIASYARRKLLLQIVSCWIQGLQAERFRFGELLATLAVYADSEMSGHEGDRESWAIVAQILREAAAAAEREGEELP